MVESDLIFPVLMVVLEKTDGRDRTVFTGNCKWNKLVAEFSMACIKDSIFEEKATPIQEKKPKKIVSNAGVKKLPRTYFRYTKLEKRVLLW